MKNKKEIDGKLMLTFCYAQKLSCIVLGESWSNCSTSFSSLVPKLDLSQPNLMLSIYLLASFSHLISHHFLDQAALEYLANMKYELLGWDFMMEKGRFFYESKLGQHETRYMNRTF